MTRRSTPIQVNVHRRSAKTQLIPDASELRIARPTCPVCHGDCDVAPNNSSGFCKSRGCGWSRVTLSPNELGMGVCRLQHQSLPADLVDMCRWIYTIVGRYVVPTLEQWEIGFLCDLRPRLQIYDWYRIAHAFITWHARRNLPLRSPKEEGLLVAMLANLDRICSPEEEEEQAFLRDCYMRPDGWDVEAERTSSLLNAPTPT